MRQRRFLNAVRNDGFSAMVSALALMRLAAIFLSLLQAGMSPQRTAVSAGRLFVEDDGDGHRRRGVVARAQLSFGRAVAVAALQSFKLGEGVAVTHGIHQSGDVARVASCAMLLNSRSSSASNAPKPKRFREAWGLRAESKSAHFTTA